MITIQASDSGYVNPLVRFVTEEAVALLLNIPVSEIKDVRCWPKMILVIADHLVRFVSYADLPPILEVETPTHQDFITWRKRWRKLKTHQAPDFWQKFYSQKFRESTDATQLYAWGRLVGLIKFALSHDSLESLRAVFREVREINYSAVH